MQTLLDVPLPEGGRDLKELLAAYESALILTALAASGGHQRRAAASLGILPTTLHEKMRRLGIPTRTEGTQDLRHAARGLVEAPALAAPVRVRQG